MRVDQLLNSVVEGDAISADAAEIRRRLLALGFDSGVYVKEAGARPRADVPTRPAEELDPGADLLIYHHSLGSALTDLFLAYPAKRVLRYHNITPARFFEGWDPPMVEVMEEGRRQLRRTGPLCELGVGVSEFNRAELGDAGFAWSEVLPVLLNPADFDAEPDPALFDSLRARAEQGPLWLFVGRFVPNKCQADLVRAFAAFKRAASPGATLVLVGVPFTSTYRDAVLGLARELGVLDSLVVRGPVSPEELAACYRAADVFVSLSEHEGFCVPLVEAMHHRVPVVAYRAAAVPETLGGAAVLLDDKDPVLVAAAVDEVLGDPEVRKALEERARLRLEELSPERTGRRLEQLVSGLLGGGRA